jgi:hypothetical protein
MNDTPFGGWKPSADTRLGRRDNALLIRSTGDDPYVEISLGHAYSAEISVEFEARTTVAGSGELFWSDERSGYRAENCVRWSMPRDGRWHRVVVAVPADRVTAIRVDPFTGPGDFQIRSMVVTGAKASDRKAWSFRGPDIAPGAPEPAQDTWEFLDNGRVRIGIKTSSGAAIGWFSRSGGRNLLNHFDKGRLIQQSWYGDEDGSVWNKQPWRWNPVQGGDWKGNPARVLKLDIAKDRLVARTMGRNWAGCTDLPEATFEETIRLDGDLARIRFTFRYTGTKQHAARHHEIPAVFLEPDLDTLVTCTAEKPWTNAPLDRSKPGWPNESRKMTEHWAAYVGADNTGVGVHVPQATELTCYRFGDGKPEHGSCSYFAPLLHTAIVPGTTISYETTLTIGTPDQIRARFARLPR